jgi:hypothetical protein
MRISELENHSDRFRLDDNWLGWHFFEKMRFDCVEVFGMVIARKQRFRDN